MKKYNHPTNVLPVTEIIKIPLYSEMRFINGQLFGCVIDLIATPIEFLQEKNGKEVRRN